MAGKSKNLTSGQTAYLLGIKRGLPKNEAKTLAGYSDKTAISVVESSDKVKLAVIRAQASFTNRADRIKGEGAEIAMQTMIDLCSDQHPGSVRFGASKWLLEAAGHAAKDRKPEADDVPLHEMTADQLASFIARAQATIEAGGSPPVITVIEPERPV